MAALIEDKSRIVIKRGDYYHMTTVKPTKSTMINKTSIKLDSLIGFKFGSYFEVVNKQVNQIEAPSCEDEDLLSYEDASSLVAMETETDCCDQTDDVMNGEEIIEDVVTSSPVTKTEVMSMKSEGVDSDQLIKSIVSKNAAFKDRTDYSKTKYIKKKLKRHKLIFQVLKPNARLISRAIFNQDNRKILNLSPMDVANVIYKCNLLPNSKIIICDGTGGLLISIILEKMIQNVTILEFFTSEYPKRDGSTFFSFDNSLFANVYPLPMKYANVETSHAFLESFKLEANGETSLQPEEKRVKLSIEDCQDSVENCSKVTEKQEKLSGNNVKSFVMGPKHYKGLDVYLEGDLDCLLLVSKFDPFIILKHCCSKLAPSKPVVIFHSCLDVIKRCADWLKEEKQAVKIEISDVFSREFQVLPNRTRPTMKPEESTGYLLTAIKVSNDIDVEENAI